MKKFSTTLFAICTLISISACSSSEKDQARQDASAAVGRTQPTMNDQRDQYVSQVETRMSDMEKRLQEMRQTASSTQDKNLKRRQDRALQDLERRIGDVRKELSDVKGQEAAKWVEERKDVDKALAQAEDAFNNAGTYVK